MRLFCCDCGFERITQICASHWKLTVVKIIKLLCLLSPNLYGKSHVSDIKTTKPTEQRVAGKSNNKEIKWPQV